jgi:gamma-carbonic anhydrase
MGPKMKQIAFEGKSPTIHTSAFVAETALVIGDVSIGRQSSLWFHSVLRGDVFPISVGNRTNIQDLCIGHVTAGRHSLIIGNEVTIGHRVVIHGCQIEDRCLIGMGSLILDGAQIGADSLIGAGTLITPNTKIPPKSLVLGSPGLVKRELTLEEIAELKQSAEHYVQLAKRHQQDSRIL